MLFGVQARVTNESDYSPLRSEWLPSLWMDVFDGLINDDNELDYGDEWCLNFNYSQTSSVSKEERKRGWKVYCSTAFGKYVHITIGKVLGYLNVSNIFWLDERG